MSKTNEIQKTGVGINVLLVYANTPMDNLIPIGVSLLAACLKEKGHNVKLFDTTFYKTRTETGDSARERTLQVKPTDLSEFGIYYNNSDMVDDFKKMIAEYKPDLIGVSCVEPTLDIALTLLNSIKDLKIPKLLGGIGVTFFREEMIQEVAVDIICLGEGEGAITDLADAIKANEDYSQIKNLWVKKNGKIIKNEMRPQIDINVLPFQDWTIYDKKRFYKPMGGKIRITGTFEFSRGCPRRCTFCCNYSLNQFHNRSRLRKKDVTLLMNEIKHAIDKHKIEYIYFTSENFFVGLGKDFDRFIEAYNEIKIPFWVQSEPQSFTEEWLSKLKTVGCDSISTGVEHGNEEFRKNMLEKHTTNEILIKAFKIAKKTGIRINANNIIGFPTETRELIFDTINLNRELKADSMMVNLFSPYRGTKLREIAVEKGYLKDNVNIGDYRISPALDQPQLPKEELLGLHRTFVLYVRMPKSKWDLIERAEKFDEEGNRIYQELIREYQDMMVN